MSEMNKNDPKSVDDIKEWIISLSDQDLASLIDVVSEETLLGFMELEDKD